MVKVALTLADGRQLLILGLSEVDIENLRDGCPHAFPGEQVGISDLDVYLLHGETDHNILELLKRKGMVPQGAEPEKPD